MPVIQVFSFLDIFQLKFCMYFMSPMHGTFSIQLIPLGLNLNNIKYNGMKGKGVPVLNQAP